MASVFHVISTERSVRLVMGYWCDTISFFSVMVQEKEFTLLMHENER